MTKSIATYLDWEGMADPVRLGVLYARTGGSREVFDLELDPITLARPELAQLHLDPEITMVAGHQYPRANAVQFGMFSDASPDRWGRMLIQRRLERDKRARRVPGSRRLLESDYLLGVHDHYRVGALRLRLRDDGELVDDRHDVAAPTFVKLRELESASMALERDVDNTAPGGNAWLQMLIAPGGSLGGARPKASVVDPEDRLWIAKFPSVRDDHDVGGWELLVQSLAAAVGLRVVDSQARRFASEHHTFLIARFDRTARGRIHYASAMTLTGHVDGNDATTGASYLELARVLIEHGAEPAADLRELWTRIVFNMLVSNADDHLRNHGFLWVPRKGWRLSPVFDMNPMPEASGLRLNISESDNALDLDLARSVASVFRVRAAMAKTIIGQLSGIVSRWRELATRLDLPRRELELMAPAFALAQ
jgi:serine/threonine-protein kinase HipA